MYNRKIRGPLVEGNKTLGQISSEILTPMETRPGLWWFIAFGISSISSAYLVFMLFI